MLATNIGYSPKHAAPPNGARMRYPRMRPRRRTGPLLLALGAAVLVAGAMMLSFAGGPGPTTGEGSHVVTESRKASVVTESRKASTAKNWLLTAVGALLTIAGVIWALQGFGVIGGSFMSGNSVWAIIGPVVALAGLVAVAVGVLRARSA